MFRIKFLPFIGFIFLLPVSLPGFSQAPSLRLLGAPVSETGPIPLNVHFSRIWGIINEGPDTLGLVLKISGGPCHPVPTSRTLAPGDTTWGGIGCLFRHRGPFRKGLTLIAYNVRGEQDFAQAMHIRGTVRDSIKVLANVISNQRIEAGKVRQGENLRLSWQLENLSEGPVQVLCKGEDSAGIFEFPGEPVPSGGRFQVKVDARANKKTGLFEKSYELEIRGADSTVQHISLDFRAEVVADE